MTECPHCHKQVEISDINFGTLFNCPLCNSVYFVGWDGQPELAATAEEMAEENPPSALYSDDNFQFENSDAYAAPEPALEAPFQETIIDSHAYSSAHQEPEEAPISEAEPTPIAEQEAPADYDFSQPLDRQVVEPSPEEAANFQDISDFGNAEEEANALTYTLTISGIDSSKIHTDLRDALTDSRFAWDASALMKTIKDGTLVFRNLNSAKAFVVVSRVKYLSVQVSWRQNVLKAP